MKKDKAQLAIVAALAVAAVVVTSWTLWKAGPITDYTSAEWRRYCDFPEPGAALTSFYWRPAPDSCYVDIEGIGKIVPGLLVIGATDYSSIRGLMSTVNDWAEPLGGYVIGFVDDQPGVVEVYFPDVIGAELDSLREQALSLKGVRYVTYEAWLLEEVE